MGRINRKQNGEKLRVQVILARESALLKKAQKEGAQKARQWPKYLGLSKSTFERVIELGRPAFRQTRQTLALVLEVRNADFLIAGKQWCGRDVSDDEILQWINEDRLHPPEMGGILESGAKLIAKASGDAPFMKLAEEFDYQPGSELPVPGTSAPLYQVPLLPAPCLPRSDEINKLRNNLLSPEGVAGPELRRVAVCGMGGLGKSVLAAILAHDESVRDRFSDGVLWTTLGTHPNLEGRLEDLCRFFDPHCRLIDQDAISRSLELKRLLANRRCLLILDNVWELSHAEYFDVCGPDGALLITTRINSIATGLRMITEEPEMLALEPALKLLAGYGSFDPGDPPHNVQQVVRYCQGHPLAIALCGAMVRDGAADWQTLGNQLSRRDLGPLEHPIGQFDLVRCLRLSIDLLRPAERECFANLAVFNESDTIPEKAVSGFWRSRHGLSSLEATKLLFKLHDRNLVRTEGTTPNRTIRLHDLIKSCARSLIHDLRHLHLELIDSYRRTASNGWHSVRDDGYYYAYFPRHLHAAQKLDQLRDLLLDFHWLEAKLRHCGVYALIRDIDLHPTGSPLMEIRRMLTQNNHILAENRTQLASQLVAYFNGSTHAEIHRLLCAARTWQTTPWFELEEPNSLAPSPAFIKSYSLNQSVLCNLEWLESTEFRAKTLAVAANEQVAACIFEYRNWERQQNCLSMSNGVVEGAACKLIPRTRLEIWDLKQDSRVLEREFTELGILKAGFLADCRTLLLALSDQSVALLDIQLDEDRSFPFAQSGCIQTLAVSDDGKQVMLVIPGSGLLLWDGADISVIPISITQVQKITDVTLNQDGSHALLALNNELYHWRKKIPDGLVSIAAFADRVESIELSPDGTHACCFVTKGMKYQLSEGKVHIWNLETGRELPGFSAEKGVVLRFGATGKNLYFCNFGPCHGIFDPVTNQTVNLTPGHVTRAGDLRVLPQSGQVLTLGHESRLKFWDDEKMLNSTSYGWDRLSELRTDKDGKVWAVRSFTGRVSVLQNGRFLDWECKVPENFGAMDLSADGRKLVTGEHPHNICLRSTIAGEPLSIFSNVNVGNTYALRFAAKDQRILVAAPDWLFGLPINRDNQIQRGWIQPLFRTCRAIAVLADGCHFATWTDTIDIRSVDSGQLIYSHLYGYNGEEHQFGNARALEASADNRFIVASFFDGRILVWDMQPEMEWLRQHENESISIQTEGDPDSGLWNNRLMTPRINAVRVFYDGNTEAFGVAISPNSRWLCAGLLDGTLRCWDLHTGDQIAVFHSEWPIETCRFGTDSQTILAGNGLGQILEFRLRAFPEVPSFQGVPPANHWPLPPARTPELEAHEKYCYDKWKLPGIWEYY